MAVDFALAGVGEDDELVGEVAADRPALGHHRDGLETEPRKSAQIGDEHAVVGVFGAGEIEVEGIGVLHQEFAPAHQPEARPHLVAELPLDVIEIERQILVRAHIGAEDLRDHFLVGRAIEHVALVPVLDAQHLLAVGLVAPALAPQVGRLDGRHQQLDGAGAVLLLAHDLADLLQHAKAERQEGIDAGCLLPDHAGAQHQPVGDDLRLLRRFAQDGQKEAGKAHAVSRESATAAWDPSETGSDLKRQGRQRLLAARCDVIAATRHDRCMRLDRYDPTNLLRPGVRPDDNTSRID